MFGLSTVIWLENALNAHGHVTFVVHKRNAVAISRPDSSLGSASL